MVYDIGLKEFNITGFDSSLRELTEIQFNLSAIVSGYTTFQNTTFNSGTFERDVTDIVTVLHMGFPLYVSQTTEREILPVGPRETVTANMGPVTDTLTASSFDAGLLGTFIDPVGGIRNLSASIAINPGGTIYGDGGASFTGNITDYSSDVTGVLSVSYIYNGVTSIPEPGTWLLLVTGLAGLVFARRKDHKI